MNLNQDFQEFVELFVAHEVEFLIVGESLLRLKHPVLVILASRLPIFKIQRSWCN